MPLTISAGGETFVSFCIAIGVYVSLLGIKAFLSWVPWLWTNKIPGMVWAISACAISVGICFVFNVDQIGSLFQTANIPIPWHWVSVSMTGLAIGISSNVLYKVVTPIGQKLKDARTGKVVRLAPGVTMPVTTDTVVSLLKLTPQGTPIPTSVGMVPNPVPNVTPDPIPVNSDAVPIWQKVPEPVCPINTNTTQPASVLPDPLTEPTPVTGIQKIKLLKIWKDATANSYPDFVLIDQKIFEVECDATSLSIKSRIAKKSDKSTESISTGSDTGTESGQDLGIVAKN